MSTAKEKEIGVWLAKLAKKQGRLTQAQAVREIRAKYGDEFIHLNKNRNRAINPGILQAFNDETPELVWSRSSFVWRTRRNTDKPGRAQR